MDTGVTLNTVCVPSENVVAREIEGEIIIVPLVAGIGDSDDELYTLNETGQAIWSRLDGVKSLRAIADELAVEFNEASALVEKDLLGLMTELARRKMVVAKAA